jgi:uncharacterized protein (TIGR00375 family)
MKLIADLHIHSKYSRACSKDLTPENLAVWAAKKGISILGTGDCLHPKWLAELKNQLVETKPGLYSLKSKDNKTLFMLTVEVASIYKQGDKVRRVHNLIFAPNFEAVDRLISSLEARGANLKADGRPIMGIPCPELLKLCKEANEAIEVVPAHAWTPHFGVFGSLSGFDSIEEAYGDMAKYIFAIETGLSSDPKMNWQISKLDKYSLISNSDAHSLRKLGREANVFEFEPKDLSYQQIIKVIKQKKPKQFLQTIEFFPEEGKYHLDGHRDHQYSCLPKETKRLKGVCPLCGKQLLRGVMHRIDDLGDRAYGFIPEKSIPFISTIPLEEIIAETLGVGVSSKKVIEKYEQIVSQVSEFSVLLDMPKQEIILLAGPEIAESVFRVRENKVTINPGYDGVFGKINIYSDEERIKLFSKRVQSKLFT